DGCPGSGAGHPLGSAALLGTPAGAVGAQVDRVAAHLHVVPHAAVVAGAVVEGDRATLVAAGLQTPPAVGALGFQHLDEHDRRHAPPAGATRFGPDPAVGAGLQDHGR